MRAIKRAHRCGTLHIERDARFTCSVRAAEMRAVQKNFYRFYLFDKKIVRKIDRLDFVERKAFVERRKQVGFDFFFTL